MIPFYVAAIFAVYRIGRALFSDRAAIWLALIAGAIPGFFFPGTEFRPDDLYAALWLWSLVVAVEGRFSMTRAAVMGLLLGFCTGITMKTALLVSSLAPAVATAFALRIWLSRWRPSTGRLVVRGTVIIAASLVVPALLLGYFAAHHALPQLSYCVLKNNVVPHAERWSRSPFPISLPADRASLHPGRRIVDLQKLAGRSNCNAPGHHRIRAGHLSPAPLRLLAGDHGSRSHARAAARPVCGHGPDPMPAPRSGCQESRPPRRRSPFALCSSGGPRFFNGVRSRST